MVSKHFESTKLERETSFAIRRSYGLQEDGNELIKKRNVISGHEWRISKYKDPHIEDE
jgi:hypothetical protein